MWLSPTLLNTEQAGELDLNELNSLGTVTLQPNFKTAAGRAAGLAEVYYKAYAMALPGAGVMLVVDDIQRGDWRAVLLDLTFSRVGQYATEAATAGVAWVTLKYGDRVLKFSSKTIGLLRKIPLPLRRQALNELDDALRLGKCVAGEEDKFLQSRLVASGRGLRPVGQFLESAHDVFANPSLLQGKSLAEVRSAIGHTPSWIEDVMRHSTTNPGGGWVFREVDAAGNLTGRLIQYHPGTPRHFGGKPYWKISGVPNQPPVRLPGL